MDKLDLDPVRLARYKPHLIDDPTWSLINRLLTREPNKDSVWNDAQLHEFWTKLGGDPNNIGTGYDRNMAIERLAKMYPNIRPSYIEIVS